MKYKKTFKLLIAFWIFVLSGLLIPFKKIYGVDSFEKPFFLAEENPRAWPAPPMIKYEKASKTRENLVIIMISGLFGSLLGLSTVSFYKRPERSLSNISLGFTFGVLGAALSLTYRFITQSKSKKAQHFSPSSFGNISSNFDGSKSSFSVEKESPDPLWLIKQKSFLFSQKKFSFSPYDF